MKKILFLLSFILVSNIANIANAEEIEYEINSNEFEQVQVDSEKNRSAAVFSTVNYTQGFFDKYRHLLQSTNLERLMIDNGLFTVPAHYDGPQASKWGTAVTFDTVFTKPVDVTGVYIKNTGDTTPVTFFDENGATLGSFTSRDGEKYTAVSYENVKSIRVVRKRVTRMYEVEFFIDPDSVYSSVLKITDTPKHNSINLKWANPQDAFLTGNKVYLNDELLYSGGKITNYEIKDLEPLTEYEITVSAMYSDIEIKAQKNITTIKDTTPPANVSDLKVEQIADEVVLSWKNPTDKDFKEVKIYKNNSLLATTSEEKFIDKNPIYEKTTTYKIVAFDNDGYGSSGASKSILVEGKTVINLKATATDFRTVSLAWKNPSRSDFEKVTIYRKKEVDGLVRLFVGGEEYQPLFETNGTTFKDLTVAADTKYTYKVTTTINDVEQTDSAKEVSIKTPRVTVVGGEGEKTENGDYIFKWEAPVTGKVQIDVAGTKYKVVAAADKQIVIPSSVIQYDAFGTPLIKLTPLDDDGNVIGDTTTGAQSSGGSAVGKVDLPNELTAKNLLLAGVGLLGVVGAFILLGLVFRLMPKLIRLIREAFEKRGVRNG